MWTIWSVVPSAEVMNRLTPSMFQVPSGFWVALVRPAPTSDPASGSVSTIVVFQPWSTISWAILRSRSLPLRHSTPANIGPAPYIQTAGLAPSTSSPIAQQMLDGAGVPPSSANVVSRQYSASIQAW